MSKTKFTEEDIKEIIERYNNGESTYEIALDFECHPETIRRILLKNGVQRRESNGNEEITIKESDVYKESVLVYNREINNLPIIPVFLDQLDSGKLIKKDATLTVVLSDLHIGHTDFLPESFYSSVKTLDNILTKLVDVYNITNVSIVLNGDIVSGRDVYRFQELDNLVTRGHWQVFLS
jgi:hypothetical protein